MGREKSSAFGMPQRGEGNTIRRFSSVGRPTKNKIEKKGRKVLTSRGRGGNIDKLSTRERPSERAHGFGRA